MHLASECMFLFKDELCKQVDGIHMEFPLGCTMANFFLGHLETIIFKVQMSCHPKLYVRCIDDAFAVSDDVNTCSSFLNILNSQHDNTKFTIEKSTNTLQFLEVDIKVNKNTVDTWVWKKLTNTGLFLNFAAMCPIKWKSNLVFCMLHRAKLICSSDLLFFREVNILKSLYSLLTITPHISLIKYCANFIRFYPLILKNMKTAMNVGLGFLQFLK